MISFLSPEALVIAALLVPLTAAGLIPLLHRTPNPRETVTLAAAALLAWTVWSLLPHVLAGARPEVEVGQVTAGLRIAFKVEPLGLMFALVAGTLWIVNSVYSIGYMRGNDEPRQTSFYVCFAVALSATMGIAFSANLFTLFLFYEALTLSTYPLVTHKGTPEAMRGGRIYLVLLIGTSMMLLLPAVVATGVIAGTLDFKDGGILAGKLTPTALAVLLGLFAFGIGKAALMPFHFWLPSAMVAPTPVSALLHAVAVVKAGVFTVVKVVVYVFGIDTLKAAGSGDWLVYAASAFLLTASLVALAQTNLKARLAYSTVSQLAYVVLAAALATSAGIVGGALHIVMHAAGKITLFFCAGAIYTAAHKTEVEELDGIGHKMPLTMLAFLIGSLSIIGLPPFGGAWSKWQIGLGALDSGHGFVLGVLMLSSLLNVAYLLPIVARAFFVPPPHGETNAVKIEEAPLACVVPLLFTASLCVVLFFFAGDIERYLSLIVTKAP